MYKALAEKKWSRARTWSLNALFCTLSLLLAGTCLASTITLQWDPETAPDLAGYKVYYSTSPTGPFNATGATQGASPVDVSLQTTATITGLDPGQPHYFAVTAYNGAGMESSYSDIVTVPELVPPTVSITSPSSNTSASAPVSVGVSATDNVGVTKVEFYVNGVLQGTDTGTPYFFSWDATALAAGSYTLVAKAYDVAGNVGTSSAVTVNVVHDTTSPTVSLTAPGNGAVLHGMVPMTASATDDTGVAKVEFYANGALLSAGNVPPYSYTWDTTTLASGSYTLSSKAYDGAGNVGQSANMQVTVDNTPPAVSFTAPASSGTVGGTVAISASASDNVAVRKVELYINGALMTTLTSSPYNFSWGTATVGNGSYTLSAKAYDSVGNVGQASETVTVFNDTVPPAMTTFAMPSTSTLLNVPVSLAATDNVGVTAFLVSESSSAPSAQDSRWSTGVPTSFTFAGYGARTAYAWARDAVGNVSSSLSASVTILDAVPPAVTAFTMPASATALTVPISALSATDNLGVTGYLVSESAAAPAATDPSWSVAAPAGFTFAGYGARTAYAWARDAAGNISASLSVAVTISDVTAPTVSSFTMPASATTLTVPVSALSAGDNVGVTGYLVSESSSAHAATAAGWSPTAPTSFTFSGYGARTAYAWAKDAAGNVSASLSVAVTINDVTAPTVSTFTMPASTTTLTVPVSDFSATDNVGVAGYLISESSSAPAPGAAGWSAAVPTSFTFAGYGARTAYAWAKDAAGNVSARVAAAVTISDVMAPTVTGFSVPATASSFTVPVSLTAIDNVAVAGYLVSESSVAPAAADSRWTSSAPTSFTFAGEGTRTAYAWAKDATGNVSAATSDSVTISLPDTTAPAISSFTMPATANSTTVAVTTLAATDNKGVTGYLISESATAPAATDSRWSVSAPMSFTFSGTGTRTAYAWAKDAAGNISAASSDSVVIDTVAPMISAMSLASSGAYVNITASATDNVKVTMVQLYADNKLLLQTSSGNFSYSWKATYKGTHTITVNASDAAGNVTSRSASVVK